MRTPLPERLTPLAASLDLVPLYGDIHNHCALSYGHGRLEDALARAALQLDFVSVTGHADWPDMPVDDPSVANIVDFHVEGFARLRDGWADHFEVLRAYDRDGRFTVFPGYEIHSCAHGDYTIVYADLDTAELQLADSPAGLRKALTAAKGDRAFAFPHHIGYRQGARGINWDSFDAALSPFVEMLSMHGCAENSDSHRPYLHSMGPVDGRSTMQSGLDRGLVFGIVGNTDHHSAFPGSYGHGRMGLHATGRDRDAIWAAMRGRATNALTGDAIHLLTVLDGAIQGGVTAPRETASLTLEAVGGGAIDSIDIIRNGRLWRRITPELQPAAIDAPPGDRVETILYLELGWGARGQSHFWEGDIQCEGGCILGVEPRFRGAEIVSPLEGSEAAHRMPSLELEDGSVRFSVTAEANPNNATPATQGLALRLRVGQDDRIRATLSGQSIDISTGRLFEGSVAGNLGPIDSPAYRFHALPLPRQWQWRGAIDLGPLHDGESVYARLRQHGGQAAWTSPIFCRADRRET